MEEVQELRHVCKICSKVCWSGKSLGGHMRVHSALISAMKKEAAEVKFDSQMVSEGGDDQEVRFQNSKNQSNSTNLDQENIKNCGSNMGDDDPKTSYELRENPKKSRGDFDAKHGDTSRNGTCKECGKVFPSLRALSGHMRCHSIKKTTENQNHCKECGKGFDSMRALFGHMKSHSNKSRRVAAESSSDLDNLCPLRKKRTRIICKIDPTPSSSVVDFGEVEEVALCLIMLSRGVKNWDRSKSGTESTGCDSAFFVDESVCKDKGVDINESGDPSSDGNKVSKMGKLEGKLDPHVLGSGNACSEKHVPCSDDLNSGFSSRNEMKLNSEISDGVLKSSCCDKALLGGHDSEFGKYLSENAHSNPKMLIDFDEKFDLNMVGSSSSVEVDACSLSVAEANYKIECTGVASFECPICLRVFSSGQALGGHKRVHYSGFTENKTSKPLAMDCDFDLNLPISIPEGEKDGAEINQWWFGTRQEPMITD